MTVVVTTFLGYTEIGLKLPLPLAIGIGMATALLCLILFFIKIKQNELAVTSAFLKNNFFWADYGIRNSTQRTA